VVVVVLNNRPGAHAEFDQIRANLTAGPHARDFVFVEAAVPDVDGGAPPPAESPPERVPKLVRRQTRAVAALLRAAAGRAAHFMFMEDDFVLCHHALRTLAYVTAKAHAYLPGCGE
jgi:hypothetical protein